MASKWWILLVLAVSGASGAQTAAPANAGDLSREHSRKILLKVQADAAEEEVRLLEASNKMAGLRASGGVAAGAGIAIPAAAAAVYEQGDQPPVVLGVFGANGDMYATLVYGSGFRHDARVGREIPGGYVMKVVQTNRVVVRDRSGRTVFLKFASSAPGAESQPGQEATTATPSPFATGVIPPPPSAALPARK